MASNKGSFVKGNTKQPKKQSKVFKTYTTPVGYICTCNETSVTYNQKSAMRAARAHTKANHTDGLIVELVES